MQAAIFAACGALRIEVREVARRVNTHGVAVVVMRHEAGLKGREDAQIREGMRRDCHTRIHMTVELIGQAQAGVAFEQGCRFVLGDICGFVEPEEVRSLDIEHQCSYLLWRALKHTGDNEQGMARLGSEAGLARPVRVTRLGAEQVIAIHIHSGMLEDRARCVVCEGFRENFTVSIAGVIAIAVEEHRDRYAAIPFRAESESDSLGSCVEDRPADGGRRDRTSARRWRVASVRQAKTRISGRVLVSAAARSSSPW